MMSPINKMTHQYQYPPPMGSIPVHLNAFTTAKQSKRRVSFKPTVTVQPIDCRMAQEEKSRLYYSKEELNTFLLEVKAIHTLSKGLPDPSSTSGAHATTRDCMLALEADPALRGLELYLCPIRVRNKVLAEKALLKYHKNLNANPNLLASEEKLQSMAATSAKLSHWSNLVAIETARLDSLRVYEGGYLIPINEPVDISLFPFPAIIKRTSQPAKRRRQC